MRAIVHYLLVCGQVIRAIATQILQDSVVVSEVNELDVSCLSFTNGGCDCLDRSGLYKTGDFVCPND